MGLIKDALEGAKLLKEKRLAEAKAEMLNNAKDLMAVYADNVVAKFKAEYFIVSNKGKRMCKITFNPFPNDALWQKILNKVSKEEYLAEFDIVLKDKLSQQGFTQVKLSNTMFNKKEPVTVCVEW